MSKKKGTKASEPAEDPEVDERAEEGGGEPPLGGEGGPEPPLAEGPGEPVRVSYKDTLFVAEPYDRGRESTVVVEPEGKPPEPEVDPE